MKSVPSGSSPREAPVIPASLGMTRKLHIYLSFACDAVAPMCSVTKLLLVIFKQLLLIISRAGEIQIEALKLVVKHLISVAHTCSHSNSHSWESELHLCCMLGGSFGEMLLLV